MRFFFKTFGCRVNQYETEALRERLLADGTSLAVADFAAADLCVVNTCSVTGEADKDALQLLRRITRRNPAARLVVTGCLATRAPEAVREAAPAAEIVDNARKAGIPALLGCRAAPEDVPLRGFAGHARAFLKVQDGCNMHCAYCVIPALRPRLESRPPAEVEREARSLLAAGHRELVLCGVRLGRYLSNDERGRRVDFPGLLERLLAIPADFRVRLSSFEITDLTERFLDLFAASGGKLCPSFHLPLQSGSDAVLRRMQRWYTTRFYARRIESLRRRRPDAGLFTDLMAGFPGEVEAEFEESVRFVLALGFSGLHVFRYSAREGTPAAAWTGQVPPALALERAERLRELDGGLRSAFAAAAVGSRRRAVVERSRSRVEALTDHFLKVTLDRDPGDGLRWVRIASARGAGAAAVVADERASFL